MMPCYGTSFAGASPNVYPTENPIDDLSWQTVLAAARRASRGSTGHHTGGPMRVAKPTSANNSPRSSVMQSRRRTLMNDGLLARWNQHLADQGCLPNETFNEPVKQSARPLSWHPSSHLIHGQTQPQTQTYQQAASQFSFSAYAMGETFPSTQQFPPTPTGYSSYASPSLAFSPLSLPYSGFDSTQYFSPNTWSLSTAAAAESLSSPVRYQPPADQFCPSLSPPQPLKAAADPAAEWNAFVTHGFDRCTAPPTPDTYPASDQPEPKLPSDESIPYQSLDEDESEGEILVGMGLYDPPEKAVSDPTLQSYRASVAHLLGSTAKYPEPTGRGLKLEDAWEPPESDDEDQDDQDADGEEQEEDE